MWYKVANKQRLEEKMKDYMIKIRTYIHDFMEKMRVEHYVEFSLALLSYGLVAIYLLYVVSKVVALPAKVVSRAFTQELLDSTRKAVYTCDLVDVVYVLEPLWEILSGVSLLVGIVWGVGIFLRHSIGSPLPTIQERVEESEESMHQQSKANRSR